ncbi:hypothetical protein F53441_10926 [Fusarium austroafricanum]|uniref:RRM domain-containing protein n=1 Tax=Fusarium austroafricanum TaxID=2364996 RepID=A0A8H4KAA2_9HYPO|nr:hypothetical protein F53441_10926 [Fusarium austroafricanum]
MNVDRSAPPSDPARIASPTAKHSNRASPFPPSTASASTSTAQAISSTTTTSTVAPIATPSAMATPGFLPPHHAFRSMASPYASSARDTPRYGTTPITGSSSPVNVLIRRLPLNTSEESLRLMVVWSQELAHVRLLPVHHSEDKGFVAALLQFRTMAGAQEAKNMLDGVANISNDASMIVEIMTNSPTVGQPYPTEALPANNSGSASSPASASSTTGPRQVSRFNGTFQSLENMSPQTTNAYPGHELPNPSSSTVYQNIFSPTSPIGNHLTEHGRVSGKSLIANDSVEDDETSDLLKDPVAYAEFNTQQRRATAPHLPIQGMGALSLNTNNMPPPGPSSLPHHMNAASAQSGPMSPSGKGIFGFPAPSSPYGRMNYPAANMSDQNPPCNTLYVGNLPIDTSEEELKALFSKQRGYKRLCFRTKQNGPMCFVEFEDVSLATKTLNELYGTLLHNSVKGGIRLSFSKNPLGVRSGQNPTHANSGAMAAMNGIMPGSVNGFPSANRPPPGLASPPGLGSGRGPFPAPAPINAGQAGPFGGFTHVQGWNGPGYSGHIAPTANGVHSPSGTFPPAYMMGR